MSLELEKMFTSFIDSRVPENWENVAYPSLKPLGTWVTDLIERLVQNIVILLEILQIMVRIRQDGFILVVCHVLPIRFHDCSQIGVC